MSSGSDRLLILGDTARDELLAAIEIRTLSFTRCARTRGMVRDVVPAGRGSTHASTRKRKATDERDLGLGPAVRSPANPASAAVRHQALGLFGSYNGHRQPELLHPARQVPAQPM